MLTATTLTNVQYVDNTVAGGYKGFYLLSSDVTATSGTYTVKAFVVTPHEMWEILVINAFEMIFIVQLIN